MKKSICGAVFILAAGHGLPLQAEIAAREYKLVIPRQPVRAALYDLSKQTGLQVGFLSRNPGEESLVIGPVDGVYTVDTALDVLLDRSGLAHKRVNELTVAVTSPPVRRAPRATPPRPWAIAGPNLRDFELEGVVVTGSRLGQTGEGPSPVTIFSREKLNELGVSTISEVLGYLPQQPYSRWAGTEAGGAQFAEMRGLGIDTTLVLVNGRRVSPSAVNVGRNAFDLNSIPLTAVERIEVLSDAASAVYGADAVGGVINIIMKKEIAHPVVEMSYGAADGGANERRASFAGGHSGDRVTASVVVDYFDRDFLLGQERDRWRNQDYRRFGSIDVRSTQAGLANVRSLSGDNLPGLNAPVAAVPRGATGLLAPEDFAATAGLQNMESLDRYSSIVPAAERLSAAAFLKVAPTPEVELFGEFLYSDRDAKSQSFPATLSGVVPAENPYNPFGTPVLVSRLFTELGPRQTLVESEFYRESVGVRLPLRTWDLEVAAVASQEDATSRITNQLDALRLNAAVSSTDPAQALNLFQDGPAASPQVIASLRAVPTIYAYASDGLQGSAVARGTVVEVPAGKIDMVIGAEWRNEKMLFDDFVRISRDRSVSAGFTELRVPIIGARQQVSGVKDLSLTVAARYDDYTDFGDTVNPQYGLVWKATSDLTFRASYGTSFRPPSLYELFAPRTPVPGFAVDPRRNGEISFPLFTTGGNADLDPIEADSLTAGFVFAPSYLAGLRLSASYWKINLDHRVAFFQPDIVLANESQYPERVVRTEPTAADIAAGLPGALVNIDMTPINFGTLETSGIDIAASYAVEMWAGHLTSSLFATWVGKYDAIKVPNTPAVDRVSVADGTGTITRWKLIGSLSWARNGLSLAATARYTSDYDDTTPVTQGPTGRRIPSLAIVDLQGAIALDDLPAFSGGWTSGTKLILGANNLFDKEPPYSDVAYVGGYDPSLGDLRQRFIYTRLQKSF